MEFGIYNNKKYLFVGSERSNAVLVYQVQGFKPELIQVLPTGVGPEGVKAIPERNLLAVASEVDDRGDKIRSSITLYELSEGPPTYPTVYSANRDDGLPIPWGALSALAADRNDSQKAYTVYDSFYQESRIFELDLSTTPPVITSEIVLNDGGATVNLDLEGISTRSDGGFWVVSEGAGSVDDLDRPVTSNNTLYQIASNGTILETIELPEAVNDLQRRFGFEGVASVDSGDDELVYVAFQREWVGDPEDHVRIGRYEVSTEEWTFFYYPIDDPTSPNGGWVGLSEIVALDDESFAVIERDNQAGTDATIKKIYRFSIDGLTPQPQGETFPVVTKELVRDLIPDLLSDNGAVLEKVEGLAVLKNGDTIFVTDNDGVDDSSGETQLQNLGPIFDEVL